MKGFLEIISQRLSEALNMLGYLLFFSSVFPVSICAYLG